MPALHALDTSPKEAIQVLVVDDDPIQRSLIAARLVRLNAITTEADDGASAWSRLKSQSFDLAIVDLCMPGLDGIGLIQCVRGHPDTRHIPIIVITSRNEPAAVEASLQAGASSFLVKPVAWTMFEHHVGFLMQLVRQARDARCLSQQALAASNAKDAIISNLIGEMACNASTILGQVQPLKHLPFAPDAVATAIAKINSAEDSCQLVMQSARKALRTLKMIEARVLVDAQTTSLTHIIENVLTIAQPEAKSHGLHLAAKLPDRQTMVSCSAAAIELALMSLLEHAYRHTPTGGSININCTVHTDNVLMMEISGQGTDKQHQPQIQYLTPMKSPAEQDGPLITAASGLQLPQAIAEAHHGRLEVRTHPDRGVTATLFLPAERIRQVPIAA